MHWVTLLGWLTAGQASEYGHANTLIEGFDPDYVLADKGYDSDEFIEAIEKTGAVPVIPPQRNRKEQREYDRVLYKECNLLKSGEFSSKSPSRSSLSHVPISSIA